MVDIRVIIFLIFFMNVFINGQLTEKCQTDIPSDKYDCFDRIDEDKKEDFRCCFRTNYESDDTQTHLCDLVGKEDFEDIEGYKEDELAATNFKKIDVDCYQYNLNIKKNSYFLLFIFNLLLMII